MANEGDSTALDSFFLVLLGVSLAAGAAAADFDVDEEA